MVNRLLSYLLLSFIPSVLAMVTAAGQNTQDDWHLLADVQIEKKWDEILQEERDFPTFGQKLRVKDGQIIELSGFMVPLEELTGQKYFVISSLPFQSCFFCGGAGPETVAEVRTRETIEFTEKKIRIKGTLRLNSADPLSLYYVLEDAEVLDH